MKVRWIKRIVSRFAGVMALAILTAGQGCIMAEHPLGLRVHNDSHTTVTVQIAGFSQPWKSKPISPGSETTVDAGDVASSPLHVKFFDSKSGRLLLDLSHPFHDRVVGASTPDEAIHYLAG